MSGDSVKSALAAMKAEKARLLEQAAAEIDREMAADIAELERLAAKYNLRVVGADSNGSTALSSVGGLPPRQLNLDDPVPPSDVVHGRLPPRQIDVGDPAPPTNNGFHFPSRQIDIDDTVPVSDLVHAAHANPANFSVQTLAELVFAYRTDERSPYRDLRFKVRLGYDSSIDRILTQCGQMKLADINADFIQKIYDEWTEGGRKLASGHALVTKLRGLFSYGTTRLDDAGCQRLSTIMNKMRFANPTARTEQLTTELVNRIRAKAHELGKPSIALAQCFQYEVMLAQKDVIGEYVPASEPGESDIIVDGSKWLYGIRWSQIDSDLILRHVTSFRQKSVEIDLKRAPMVMEEIKTIYGDVLPKTGPIIRSEWNEKPWSSAEFRRWWRKIADAAGVPKNIKNMDSRPVEHRSVTTRNSLNAIQRREGLVN